MVNALFCRQAREQREIVSLLFIDFKICDSEIVKRNEHIVFKSVLKRNAIGNYVIEQCIHVIAIGSRRRRRHSKNEFWLKIVKYLLVTIGSCPMCFIDNDVIEIIGRELVEFRGKRNDHGEKACCVSFALVGKLTIGIPVAENAPEAFHRCVEDSLSMCDEEYAFRRAGGNV